ncbi:MAG TPA: LysR family transcriptional regulator [Steroidobacteraceae bacterium]
MEKPPFDLNLLRVLLALERTRHVTRAAELLHMSQSGFSSALARLRRYSDDQLFVRTSGGMVPSPYARRMIDAAGVALATFEEGISQQPLFAPADSHTEFSFAMTDLAEMVFLPRLLNHLQNIAPSVNVRCESLPEEQVQQALSSGQVDLALGYFPELTGELFFRQRLYSHTFACIIRRDHPLDAGVMSTTIFSELGHVEVSSPSRTGRLFESLLRRKGIKRRVVLRTPHHLSLPAIVENTNLVATVPLAVAVWFARHKVKLVPLPFNPGTFEVNQHWHRRYHQDSRHRWLRQQVSALFNDATDSWRETAEKLYAKKRTTKGR